MSKPKPSNTVRIEAWSVSAPKSTVHPNGRKTVTKVATRNHLGQFHGATNFRGSIVNP